MPIVSETPNSRYVYICDALFWDVKITHVDPVDKKY